MNVVVRTLPTMEAQRDTNSGTAYIKVTKLLLCHLSYGGTVLTLDSSVPVAHP